MRRITRKEFKGEMILSESIRDAARDGRIRAYFQPLIRSMTRKVIGAEALARWFSPDGSMLSPGDFIPALEESGHIFDLDMEILRQACALYDEFRRRGTPLTCVSVNLSRQDFAHGDLFEQICSVLAAYDVPHEAIKLEITESILLEDTETFEKIFRRFSDAGFSVWLDDFGSGYSSLNVLQNYSFDVIKFDMLFLRKLSARGRHMLASLISMAKTLEIHTLTEGVETEEQRNFLQSVGCEGMQGFLYSRPLPKEELAAMADRDPQILESPEDKKYWDQIGRLNLVNPNPLKDYAERREHSLAANYVSSYDGSVALVECGRQQFSYIYATDGYRERLRELGFTSVGGLEDALSSQRGHQYMMFRKLVRDAVEQGTIQTIEYAYRDVYYRLSALFIARNLDRAMIVMRLNTFDSEHEVRTAREMLNSSSALLSTYELVVLFYPEKKIAKRIHTTNILPEYDRETSFEISLRKFCEAEVLPEDQERYLRFMNFGTMAERIGNSPDQFIQNVFRMRLKKDRNNWYTARVTQVPTYTETVFMLTVQSIQGSLNNWLDSYAKENPDLS